MQKLLEKDQRARGFVKYDDGLKERTIEDWQRDVSNINVIPDVSEAVKRLFDNAKDLYVFGYFRYNFFTISTHYALLALESAIRNRYYQSLGGTVTLSNARGGSIRMAHPSHQRILAFCRARKNWHPDSVYIGDEKFAYRPNELLKWLEENDIITIWERKMCRMCLDSRNYLSHPTFSPIHLPGSAATTIRRVAELINKMYFSQAN